MTTKYNEAYRLGQEDAHEFVSNQTLSPNYKSYRDIKPEHYLQVGLEASEKLDTPEFEEYYGRLGKQYEELAEYGEFDSYDVDPEFLQVAEQMYGFKPAKVYAALDFLGFSDGTPPTIDSPNAHTETQQLPLPNQEEVSSFRQEAAKWLKLDASDSKVDRAFGIVEQFIQRLPDENLAALDGQSDIQVFKTLYRHAHHEITEAHAKRDAQRAKMPSNSTNKISLASNTNFSTKARFKQSDIDRMSPEMYARNADKILRAYQLGLVEK